MIATLQACPERDALRVRAADFSVERAVGRYVEPLTSRAVRATAWRQSVILPTKRPAGDEKSKAAVDSPLP